MNKKQKIVLIAGLAIITIILGYWFITSGEVFTKSEVLVEVYDELFDTTTKEWQKKFVLGLDYAGPFSAVVLFITLFLLRIFKTKVGNTNA